MKNIDSIVFYYKTFMHPPLMRLTYSFWKEKHDALCVLAGLIRSLLRKAR